MGSLLHELNNCCFNCGQTKFEIFGSHHSERFLNRPLLRVFLPLPWLPLPLRNRRKQASYLRGTDLESNTHPLQFQSEQMFFNHLGLG